MEGAAQYRLIFLHGLGGSGDEWESVLKNHIPSNLKLICPNAPKSPVSVNRGMVMRSWFDIINLNPKNISENDHGVKLASDNIKSIIQEEIQNGTPADRIILGGISQGGALSIFTCLSLASEGIILGGLLLLSTWIPAKGKFPYGYTGKDLKIPMYQSHGESDHLVVFKFGDDANKMLRGVLGSEVTFNTYPYLGHCDYSKNELKDIEKWLMRLRYEN